MSKVKEIKLIPIEPEIRTIHIVGDSDLVLNKMDDVTVRNQKNKLSDKAPSLEKPNEWEKIITSIHWRDGKPKEFSEESMYEALKNNAPCISAYGLLKSFGNAVVRNELDKYSTKFFANVNILAPSNLIPITFTEWYLNEALMKPPASRGSLILSKFNHFSGWEATFKIAFLNNAYSVEQIVNIVNLAGFGIGIGSSRPSGYGRYHVAAVE